MEQENTPVEQNTQPTPFENEPQKSTGPVVGIIIVITLLVIGALYVWQTKLPKEPADETLTPDAATQALEQQSTSTEPDAIEQDLLNTDLELNAGMESLLIEAE